MKLSEPTTPEDSTRADTPETQSPLPNIPQTL
jgi:hypothetical protein